MDNWQIISKRCSVTFYSNAVKWQSRKNNSKGNNSCWNYSQHNEILQVCPLVFILFIVLLGDYHTFLSVGREQGVLFAVTVQAQLTCTWEWMEVIRGVNSTTALEVWIPCKTCLPPKWQVCPLFPLVTSSSRLAISQGMNDFLPFVAHSLLTVISSLC